MPDPRPKFWNNDLNNIVFSFHNKIHFFGCMFLAVVLGFGYSYGAGIAWEIKDGIGPWWDDPKWKHYNTDKGIKAWLIANLWMSDKFSFQDAFVWDLGGAVVGQIIRSILIVYLEGLPNV